MKKIYMLLAAVLLMVMAGCGGGDDSKSPPSTSKAITAFYLSGVVGTIDETASPKTISVTMPYGTDVTSLVAMFRTTGASVQVGSTDQISEATSNDFSSPVDYTVTAEDGSSVIYTVTVTATTTPKLRAFTAFSLNGVAGTINETEKKISVRMTSGTDVTALVATFTTAAGATVTVGSTPQTSGVTPNNFTKPVVYTVTNAGSSANYTVKINDYVLTKREYDSDKNGTPDTIYYYSYYTDGRRAKDQIDSDNNGKIDSAVIYGYDANYNNTKVEYDTNNNGIIDYVYYYTYDTNDKITKTEFDLYNDGTIDSVINYTYNSDGNVLTEEHDNNLDGTPDAVYDYTYDGGNLIQVAYDSDNNGFYDYIENYTYDAGKKTKTEIDSNNDGNIDSVYYYTYDTTSGNLTTEEYDYDNNTTIDDTMIYTYDPTSGNLTRKEYSYWVNLYYWTLI